MPVPGLFILMLLTLLILDLISIKLNIKLTCNHHYLFILLIYFFHDGFTNFHDGLLIARSISFANISKPSYP